MESNMVNSEKNYIKIIKEYFLKNIQEFKLVKENFHGPFWHTKFSNGEIVIIIEGDIGFDARIVIGETEYPLWQFDRSVGSKTETNIENINFVLEVIKSFFKRDNEE